MKYWLSLLFESMYFNFLLHVLSKNENIKNSFPQDTKNQKSAKINSRKNFVPHGRSLNTLGNITLQ